MKVIRSNSCGNSPKSLFAEEISILFVKKDFKKLSKYLSSDFTFKNTSQTEVKEERLVDFFKNFHQAKSAKIEFVISHGKYAAAQFVLKDHNPSHFCLTIEAESSTFKEIKRMCLFRME